MSLCPAVISKEPERVITRFCGLLSLHGKGSKSLSRPRGHARVLLAGEAPELDGPRARAPADCTCAQRAPREGGALARCCPRPPPLMPLQPPSGPSGLFSRPGRTWVREGVRQSPAPPHPPLTPRGRTASAPVARPSLAPLRPHPAPPLVSGPRGSPPATTSPPPLSSPWLQSSTDAGRSLCPCPIIIGTGRVDDPV